MGVDPISTIKNISEIVKKYNDLELMKQVIDLQTEVFDLQRENRELREQLEQRSKMQMKGPHGYYYQEGDEVPYCPRCWENDRKAIHLPKDEDYYFGHGRVCRVCKFRYTEGPSQEPRETQRGRGGPWS